MKKLLILCAFTLFVVATISAQNDVEKVKVSGTVFDPTPGIEQGEPWVNIEFRKNDSLVVKLQTDFDGKFSCNLEKDVRYEMKIYGVGYFTMTGLVRFSTDWDIGLIYLNRSGGHYIVKENEKKYYRRLNENERIPIRD